MTVAADTREAVREHPFLETALRAGVVNYTAAARFLEERTRDGGDRGRDGDREAVAAALRRYAEELDDYEDPDRRASVSMRSGVGETADGTDALLSVGETGYAANGGDMTGVVAAGEVDAASLTRVLGRLRTAGVTVAAAGGSDGSLVVVVDRRDGANAVRAVEDAL